MYDDVKPIDGALETINKLKKFGFRIVYPTCTPLETPHVKFRWLEKYGFTQDINDYVELTDKSLIRADVLVDDRPKNLDTFEGKKVLFSQPWNESEKYNINYLYADSWYKVLDYCYE